MNTLLIIALGALSGLVVAMIILVGLLTYRKKLMREEAQLKTMEVSLTLSSSDVAEEEDEQRIRHQQ